MTNQAKPPAALTGYAWGLLTISIWALWMIATRSAAKTTLDTFDLAALRFASAGLVLLPVALRMRRFQPARIGWGIWTTLLCGAGIVYAIVSAIGFRYAPISHGSVMLPGTMPLFVALLSVVLLGETIAGTRKIGFALIPLGVVTLVFAGAHHGTGQEWIGQATFIFSAMLWASYTIAMRKSGLTAIEVAAVVCVWSAILYLPPYAIYVAWTLDSGLLRESWNELFAQALMQGVLPSAVSLFTFNRTLTILGPSRGAALASLVPVVATLSAIPLLGEWPSSTDWLGLAAITAGVYLATGAPLPAFLTHRAAN
ncbi:MAG: EamA/RhaT family transporter [Tagaea sp. CACIAM 22H2]|nr:EamA/RhaT family transporter [Tagaea sp. CACIAM 22H2]